MVKQAACAAASSSSEVGAAAIVLEAAAESVRIGFERGALGAALADSLFAPPFPMNCELLCRTWRVLLKTSNAAVE
jgi:hypothetical protein